MSAPTERIRVLVADDEVLIRGAVEALLALEEDLEVLPGVSDGIAAVATWVWPLGVDGSARDAANARANIDLPIASETRDVLHIPAGRPVDVEITTADVIHSFWVPRLAGKLDAIPGHVNVLRIEADGPGEFKGVSAEFNGTGYLAHRFRVIAHDPAGWQRFLAGATE